MKKWVVTFLLIFLIATLAVFFRTYRFANTMVFGCDEGIDMLVVHHMLQERRYPLVGPVLGIRPLNTPPSYYYLLYGLFLLTGDEWGVYAGFLVLNLVTIALFSYLGWLIAGSSGMFIMAALSAISVTLISHGRWFWSPYVLQPLLALYLILLVHAFRKKRAGLLWLANSALFWATTFYPSPVLLLPYAVYQTFRFYRLRISPKARAMLISAVTLIAAAIPPYIPQLIYELMTRKFTLATLAEPAYLPTISEAATRIALNVSLLATSFIPFSSSNRTPSILSLLFIGCLMWLLHQSVRHTHKEDTEHMAYIAPLPLLLGLVGIVIAPDLFPHRMWGYLPFLFVSMALAVWYAWQMRGVMRIFGVALFCIYAAANITGFVTWYRSNNRFDIVQKQELAGIIGHDFKPRGLKPEHAVIEYDPKSRRCGWQAAEIVYWMEKHNQFKVPLTTEGNFIHIPEITASTELVYLVCQQHDTRSCIEDFTNLYPDFILTRRYDAQHTGVYVLTRR